VLIHFQGQLGQTGAGKLYQYVTSYPGQLTWAFLQQKLNRYTMQCLYHRVQANVWLRATETEISRLRRKDFWSSLFCNLQIENMSLC